MGEIEIEYTPAELRAARTPTAPPEPGTAAFGTWQRSMDLWDKAQAYRVHARQVSLLRIGLGVSFLIQLAIIAWVLFGLLRRARRWRQSLERQDARG